VHHIFNTIDNQLTRTFLKYVVTSMADSQDWKKLF
jgi:hypothetical protein